MTIFLVSYLTAEPPEALMYELDPTVAADVLGESKVSGIIRLSGLCRSHYSSAPSAVFHRRPKVLKLSRKGPPLRSRCLCRLVHEHRIELHLVCQIRGIHAAVSCDYRDPAVLRSHVAGTTDRGCTHNGPSHRGTCTPCCVLPCHS